MPPWLTYGLVAACGALFVLGFWFESEKREGTPLGPYRRFAWLVQLAAVALAYLVMRPGRGTPDPAGAVRTAKNDRTPVFLDFYSNY